jgi:prefoldin subunit 5
MSDTSHEDMGALKQAVTTLTAEVGALRRDMADVNRTLSEIRGGKKALWALLGAAGFLGGLATWALQNLSLK